MDIYVKKFFDFHIFSFFASFQSRFYHIHNFTCVEASKIARVRSHMEYLLQIYNILVIILYSKLIVGFQCD